MDASDVLIQTEKLCMDYVSHQRLFRHKQVQAVKDVDLAIRRGEVVALVGESGSGKSTLGRLLVRLATPTSGKVLFDGVDIAGLRGRALRRYRKRVAIVFQNPYRSLNPRMRVGRAIAEVLEVWQVVEPREFAGEVARLLESVGLPAHYAQRFPHELSGGERQRTAIARALAVRPEFMVADEAVSSLDVSAAAEVLNLLMGLRKDLRLTCLFVTHDLSVAKVLADRVAVMKTGEIVDEGSPKELFEHARHPYTRLLMDSHLALPSSGEEGGDHTPASASG